MRKLNPRIDDMLRDVTQHAGLVDSVATEINIKLAGCNTLRYKPTDHYSHRLCSGIPKIIDDRGTELSNKRMGVKLTKPTPRTLTRHRNTTPLPPLDRDTSLPRAYREGRQITVHTGLR